MAEPTRSGPLKGVKVLEFEALGPAPHCAMMLADLGASVWTIARVTESSDGPRRERKYQTHLRGRSGRLALDLKSPAARETVDALVQQADVLIEGFRPGVMERLDLHAERCTQLNPRLIYAQVTGWGQTGPWRHRAGHDINYIATTGLLSLIGRPGQPPTVPLNLVGDYGGGSMLAVAGITTALYEREKSGQGQVIDVAMTDGAALLGTTVFGACAAGHWTAALGSNLLDGGAPYYDVYVTRDGRYMAVGALEDKFYSAFLYGLGLGTAPLPTRTERRNWPQLREMFTRKFSERTLAQWTAVFDALDACVTPVLTPQEAVLHVQATSREAFVERQGVVQPAPAPRFSRTPARASEVAETANANKLDW